MIHKEFELVVANFIDLGDTGGEECLFNNDPNFPRLAFSPFNQPCSFSNFPLSSSMKIMILDNITENTKQLLH